MDKYQPYELAQMQQVPLEGKILMTMQRIRAWYDYWDGKVYVSFSGGKDSTVLKHIVESMYDDVPSVFVNTGLEYPEIQKFAMAQENVTTVYPKKRFSEVVTEFGYPIISKEAAYTIQYARSAGENSRVYKKLFGTLKDDEGGKSKFCMDKWSYLYDAPFKISARCCDIMKKEPAKRYEKETGRRPIIATMASEGRARKTAWLRTGCNSFDGERPRSAPMSFWTEQDVLHYLVKYNVPYCPVYGDIRLKRDNEEELSGQINAMDYIKAYQPEDILETTGCDRTGCMFCMFGCHLEKEPNRFQRLKKTHPKQYDYCIHGGKEENGLWQPSKEGLGIGKILDIIGVKY